MKLIAKKGTALEQTIKRMVEKINEGNDVTNKLVEKVAGVRPILIYHLDHWGLIYKMMPIFSFNDEDIARINPHALRKTSEKYWVPNLRCKEGKMLFNDFRRYSKAYEVKKEALLEFGIRQVDKEINQVDFKNVKSFRIVPLYDADKDAYMLLCPIGIVRGFDEEKLASDQFVFDY